MVSLRPPSGGSRYYLYDGLGNTVAVTNSAGAVVNTYDYDPYGELRASTEAFTNVFRFGGAYGGFTDVSTGLVKIGHRFYDPLLGRWTQLDPMGGGYVYVGCNPVNSVDPSGLQGTTPECEAFGVTSGTLIAQAYLPSWAGVVAGRLGFSISLAMSIEQGDTVGAILSGVAWVGGFADFFFGPGDIVAFLFGLPEFLWSRDQCLRSLGVT